MSQPEGRLQQAARQLVKAEGGYLVTLNPSNGDGEPDLIGVMCGRCFAIELKTGTEQPTTSQRIHLTLWRHAGAIAHCCRSLTDVRAVLDECRYNPSTVYDASTIAVARHTINTDPRQEPLA